MNQLKTLRRLERGWEYVSFQADNDRLRVLEYQTGNTAEEKEEYKRYLCFLCGYPEEEWMRVADVNVTVDEYGEFTFTVKFANPGKWYENLVSNDKKFVMLGVSTLTEHDEEAWAIVKRMISKSASGNASMAGTDQPLAPT